MVTLEKIDQVVERTGVSFEVARDALNACDGDVIEAIINIEKDFGDDHSKNLKVSDLMETLKEYVRKGNVNKIIVENNGEVILNMPVTIGAIGIILAPVVAVLGVGAAAFMKVTIKIQDEAGNIIDINQITADKIQMFKKKGEEIKEKIKQKESDCDCNCDCDCEDGCDADCDCNCDCNTEAESNENSESK